MGHHSQGVAVTATEKSCSLVPTDQQQMLSGREQEAGRSAGRRPLGLMSTGYTQERGRDKHGCSGSGQLSGSHEAGMYFTPSGSVRFFCSLSGVSRASLSGFLSSVQYSVGTKAVIFGGDGDVQTAQG